MLIAHSLRFKAYIMGLQPVCFHIMQKMTFETLPFARQFWCQHFDDGLTSQTKLEQGISKVIMLQATIQLCRDFKQFAFVPGLSGLLDADRHSMQTIWPSQVKLKGSAQA